MEFLEDFSDTLLVPAQSIKYTVSDNECTDSNQGKDSHDWPLQKYWSGNHTIEVMVRNTWLATKSLEYGLIICWLLPCY